MGTFPRGEAPESIAAELPLRRYGPGDEILARQHQETARQALRGERGRSRVVIPEIGKTLLVLGQPVLRAGRVEGVLVAWVDLEPVLEVLRRENRKGRLSVWLMEGRQVLATAGRAAPDSDWRPLMGDGEGMRLARSSDGSPVLEGSVGVPPLGWQLLWVYPLPEVSEAFRALLWQVGISVAAAALLAWLLGGLVSRRIAAPVEALSASALAIARGDFAAPAPDPGPYSEFEVLTESFETMRRNLVEAVAENDRLFRYTEEVLRARVAELQVLYNLTEASAERGDVASLAEVLVDHVERLLPGSLAVLWHRDAQGQMVRRAAFGLAEEAQVSLQPPPLDGLPGGAASLLSRPVVQLTAAEVAADPLVRGRFSDLQEREYCLVALSVRDRLLGVLEVVPTRGTILEEGLVELLKALAREVGLALENARLYGRNVAARRFNEAVLEEMADGVLTLDAAARVTSFNRAAERISGWDRREVLNRPVEEIFRMAVAEHPLKRLVRPGAAASPFEAELALRAGTRKVILFSPTVPAPVGGLEEGPAAIVVFRDISRLRELEDLRRDFTSTISHELRTPLTAIKGYVAMLMHPKARLDAESVGGTLALVNHQVDHLNRLIADLLEAARLRNAALEVHPRRVEVVELLRARVEAAECGPGQTLRLEGQGPIWAWCDPDHIAYVIDHLLSNAVKYSLAQGEVVVSATAEAGVIRMSVRDFGVGIPADQQERIFELYHRVESGSTRIHYGIGVGLFIARKIVEAHGGTLTVDSEPGTGSVFTACLPAAEEVEESHG